jgi:hypothetical protein
MDRVRPRVKIVSRGTLVDSEVFVDGVKLHNVQAAEWSMRAEDGVAFARLELFDVELDVEGELLPLENDAP